MVESATTETSAVHVFSQAPLGLDPVLQNGLEVTKGAPVKKHMKVPRNFTNVEMAERHLNMVHNQTERQRQHCKEPQ